jgi:integrase
MALRRRQATEQGVEGPELPALWPWRPHFTRHAYGSYSLAPESSGGLGWSVKSVQESMGHRSEVTTMEIYRHVTSGEREKVRTTMNKWEGL